MSLSSYLPFCYSGIAAILYRRLNQVLQPEDCASHKSSICGSESPRHSTYISYTWCSPLMHGAGTCGVIATKERLYC